MPRSNTEALLHGGNMCLGKLSGVIVNMTSNGQAPAFNSVGQDRHRSILDLRSSGKRLEDLGDVVPSQIHEQVFESGIVHIGEQQRHVSPNPSAPFQHSTTNFGAIRIEQTLVLSIGTVIDRKSTRLNSSHLGISYAVFCLKKKTQIKNMM